MTASGSSSHHERIRRCTRMPNSASGMRASARGHEAQRLGEKTAMMVIATRSSTTARMSRKVHSAAGRWVPITASTAAHRVRVALNRAYQESGAEWRLPAAVVSA